MFNHQLAENQDTTRRTKLMANYMAINVLLLYCAETIILSKRLSPVFVEFLSKPHRDLTEFLLLSFCQYFFDIRLQFASVGCPKKG